MADPAHHFDEEQWVQAFWLCKWTATRENQVKLKLIKDGDIPLQKKKKVWAERVFGANSANR